MQPAPIPQNEKERLVSLYKLGLLDTKPEERFDKITRIAAKIFHVPISTLTLVDNKREWFKSVCGLDQREGERAISFCGHALLADEILVIPDTKKDKRFADNPMVTGKPYLRFYAGAPILNADGQRVGVFCIKDIKPRTFSKNNEEVLASLAEWAELEVNSRNLSLALNEVREARVELKAQRQKLGKAKIAAQNVYEDLLAEKEKLTYAKAKDEAMLFSLADGLAATDKNGIIILVNKAFENMLKGREKEMRGKKLVEIVSLLREQGKPLAASERPIIKALKGAVVTTTTTTTTTYLFARKDASQFPVAVTVTPIILNGSVVGAVSIYRDITKEKEIEKMRIDFLALASHQLRTPLSGTKWLIETMQKGTVGRLNSKQKEYIDNIYQANERMIKLVSDMLNVLMLESGVAVIKKQKVPVTDLCKELFLVMRAAARNKRITLHDVFKNQPLLWLETDPQILRTILECFMSNAINYSKDGQAVVLDVKEESNVVVFSVKDSGIGIPQTEQSKMFERFYRASNAKDFKPDGTGLGLYIASMLARKLGGKISFESPVRRSPDGFSRMAGGEEGNGSIFYLQMPKKINSNDKSNIIK